MRRVFALVTLLAVGCTSAPASAPSGQASPRSVPSAPVDADATVPSDGEVSEAAANPGRTGFDGRTWHLPVSLRDEMHGTTWKRGCPVPLHDLRLLRFNYWGFEGALKRGPMVVHEDVAEDVLWVFGRLFKARFPIKHVTLAKEFVPEEFEPVISSPRSPTAAFNCRPVVTPRGPGNDFSQHSYGLAVDINPVQNPFVTSDGFVRNRMSRRYLDRSRDLAGMIHDGDLVVRSFAAIGWEWGGHWSEGKDYMHFSLRGD